MGFDINKIDTVFIVNSFNRISLLKKAIDSLIAYCSTNNNTAILVYEVGSSDGSKEWLEQLGINSLFLVTSPTPKTFSEGCNYAVAQAATLFPNIQQFILFETDNYLANQKPIEQAIGLLNSHQTTGAVGFTVQKYDGTFLIPGSTFLKTSVTILGLTLSDKLNLERMKLNNWQTFNGFTWHYYDVLYTSPLVIKYQAWKKTGGMDSVNFPFSESDTDWAFRLFKAGYKTALIKCSGVIHDNASTQSNWSSKRVVDVHKARINYTIKHKGLFVSNAIKPLLCVRHAMEWLFFLLQKRDKSIIEIRKKMIATVWCNYQ